MALLTARNISGQSQKYFKKLPYFNTDIPLAMVTYKKCKLNICKLKLKLYLTKKLVATKTTKPRNP